MTFKARLNTQIGVFLVLGTSGYTDVLFSKRKNSEHYDGFYSLIGGKLENEENLIKGLIREV